MLEHRQIHGPAPYITYGVGYALSLRVARELCRLAPRGCRGRSQDLFEFDRHGWVECNGLEYKRTGEERGEESRERLLGWGIYVGWSLMFPEGALGAGPFGGGAPSQGLRGCGAANRRASQTTRIHASINQGPFLKDGG